ncbi:MAG: conjugal transfer protein TrbF [Alphaproteobacteria bacterium]|nr:conjugal transfer protein TrbF [Alphaproteobacteria bacterium]MDE2110228.1 conjugal transfer protein TrbF [Alphaproteobacteria bacterium]
MLFKRTLQRYGKTPEPVTPYQKAAQNWDERIGSARVQAKNWRFMAFGCLVLSIGLSAGLIWQSMQSRVTPYVVEVDKLGEVQAVAPAIEHYQPTDAEIAWYLARFITDVRSLPIDPVLVRKDWLEAYGFATDHAAVFLNGYAQANDPFKAIGDRSVSVDVTSVVRASDTSFQVKWTEITYQQGSLVSTTRWTAILTILVKPPRTAEVLRKNPLGLYVDSIAWSREFDAGAKN